MGILLYVYKLYKVVLTLEYVYESVMTSGDLWCRFNKAVLSRSAFYKVVVLTFKSVNR